MTHLEKNKYGRHFDVNKTSVIFIENRNWCSHYEKNRMKIHPNIPLLGIYSKK